MFLVNDEIMILNCIYKTNRYNMFLIVLTRTICLNISFYIEFVFFKNEKLSNYQ